MDNLQNSGRRRLAAGGAFGGIILRIRLRVGIVQHLLKRCLIAGPNAAFTSLKSAIKAGVSVPASCRMARMAARSMSIPLDGVDGRNRDGEVRGCSRDIGRRASGLRGPQRRQGEIALRLRS